MSVDNKTKYALCKKEDDCDPIFPSEEAMKRSLSRLCHGDLYTIGRIWIHSLRAGLLGVKLCPFPEIHAAAKEKDPEKPKPMRATDLPIYDCPHLRYRNFEDDKYRCESKLMHDAVLPHVKEMRENVQNSIRDAKQEFRNTCNEIRADMASAQNSIKKYWRDECRLPARRGCVAAGTLLGYYMGSKGGVSKRLFYAACGAFVTGMLCFPEETDATVRDFCHYTGKAVVRGFNYMSGRNLEIRDHIPCPKPKPPDEKYVIKCGCK